MVAQFVVATITVLTRDCKIDNLHISHNASGMGANIRVLVT